MEEVKKYNRVLFLVVLIKILGGLLSHSYTMLASCVVDLLLIISSMIATIKNEGGRGNNIITTLIGLIMILSGIIMVVFSIRYDLGKVSAWIILFSFLTMTIKYMVSCYYTSVSYRRKNGLLSYGNIISTLDFISFALFIGTMILVKLSKWVTIFKYADILGTILITGFLVYKGIRIIINSFKQIEENKLNEILEKCKNEIVTSKEVKKVEKLVLSNYGGLSYCKCGVILAERVSMLDANTFVITLQDYLLKIADVVKIDLVDPNIKPKHVKVRSLKEDARNSRSRNSKTNVKKANSTKKNKKR